MRKLVTSVLVGGGLIVSAAATPTPAYSADQYTFAVGSLGGTFGRLGAGLVEIFNQKQEKSKFSVVPGGGKSNPARIGTLGADMGFSFGNLIKNARAGQSPYKKAYSNLRMVANFYDSCYHQYAAKELVAGGVKSMDDLVASKTPQKISVGKKGTSTEYIASLMMKHLGTSYKGLEKRGYKIVFAGVSASSRQIRSRGIDYYLHNSGIPNAGGIQAHLSRDLVFLKMTDGTKKALMNAGFAKCVIPGGIYKGAPGETHSVGTNGVVIATEKTPTDLVYNFLKITHGNPKFLHNVHKIFKKWTKKKASVDLGIPKHPGAIKYYKEAGLM
jgi:uncharacterized protein